MTGAKVVDVARQWRKTSQNKRDEIADTLPIRYAVAALEGILDIASDPDANKPGIIKGYTLVKLATLKDILENGSVPE